MTDMSYPQREKLIGFYRELSDIQMESDSLSKLVQLLKQVKTEYQGN